MAFLLPNSENVSRFSDYVSLFTPKTAIFAASYSVFT